MAKSSRRSFGQGKPDPDDAASNDALDESGIEPDLQETETSETADPTDAVAIADDDVDANMLELAERHAQDATGEPVPSVEDTTDLDAPDLDDDDSDDDDDDVRIADDDDDSDDDDSDDDDSDDDDDDVRIADDDDDDDDVRIADDDDDSDSDFDDDDDVADGAAAVKAKKKVKDTKKSKAAKDNDKKSKEGKKSKSQRSTEPAQSRGVARFVRETYAELTKVVWPTKKQMVTYTIVVMVFVVALVVLVGFFDIGVKDLMAKIFA